MQWLLWLWSNFYSNNNWLLGIQFCLLAFVCHSFILDLQSALQCQVLPITVTLVSTWNPHKGEDHSIRSSSSRSSTPSSFDPHFLHVPLHSVLPFDPIITTNCQVIRTKWCCNTLYTLRNIGCHPRVLSQN